MPAQASRSREWMFRLVLMGISFLVLLDAQKGLGRFIAAEIWNRGLAQENRVRGFAVLMRAAGVERFYGLLRKEIRELLDPEGIRFGAVARLLGAMRVLIRDDEFEVLSPPDRAIDAQTLDGREIVGLGADSVCVEGFDRRDVFLTRSVRRARGEERR